MNTTVDSTTNKLYTSNNGRVFTCFVLFYRETKNWEITRMLVKKEYVDLGYSNGIKPDPSLYGILAEIPVKHVHNINRFYSKLDWGYKQA